jgi:transcriptional regulator with XRE-family HTH domain
VSWRPTAQDAMSLTGDQVRAARELLGLTRPALAVITQCATTGIANFEEGRSSFEPDLLATLRQALEYAGLDLSRRTERDRA